MAWWPVGGFPAPLWVVLLSEQLSLQGLTIIRDITVMGMIPTIMVVVPTTMVVVPTTTSNRIRITATDIGQSTNRAQC
jgi:hypothetical protein